MRLHEHKLTRSAWDTRLRGLGPQLLPGAAHAEHEAKYGRGATTCGWRIWSVAELGRREADWTELGRDAMNPDRVGPA